MNDLEYAPPDGPDLNVTLGIPRWALFGGVGLGALAVAALLSGLIYSKWK